MFALRGIVISLAVFALLYSLLSFAVLFTWRGLGLCVKPFSARRRAELFFGLRVLPLLCAALVTVVFAIPSFVILEPRSIQERLSGVPLLLALLGLAVVLYGFGKSLTALRRASRMIAKWTRGAVGVETRSAVRVLQVSGDVPAMTAAGVARPRVLLSGAARSVLSAAELDAALSHELAHVHRRDNFRKLLLQFVAFPGMSGLEFAWLEATEMAADDAAVSNAGEALDLASALVKLSRFSPPNPPVELTAALVPSPASLVDARVKRLIAWKEQSQTRRTYPLWCGIGAGSIGLSALVLGYAPFLVRIHAMTEWMVR